MRLHCHHVDDVIDNDELSLATAPPLPSHLWHPRQADREIMRGVRAAHMNWCEQAELRMRDNQRVK